MLMFEWILVLLLAAVILTNLAERLAVPYPSLLAIAGVGLAFLPFAPQIRIEPELALALFVAPALLDAAFDTSPRDLRPFNTTPGYFIVSRDPILQSIHLISASSIANPRFVTRLKTFGDQF